MSNPSTTIGSFVDVGWGRLIFAHTFPDPQSVADILLQEQLNRRDIAFYVNDPQLVLRVAPQDLFLDPSTTYRLDLKTWKRQSQIDSPIRVTGVESKKDIDEINRIYSANGMVPVDTETVWQSREDDRFKYFLARPQDSQEIVGVSLGVDHTSCFDDMFNSSSLWALAVDPQTKYPGVGTELVSHLADFFAQRGRHLMDLSVLQESEAAIRLYEGLGFERVPVFTVKRRNQINEPLFVAQDVQEGYNPYAMIIIEEALRRGIIVEPIDPPRGYFRLGHGNRRITCRESLSDLTSSISMSRCADKQLTAELLSNVGLSVPDQIAYTNDQKASEFLKEHGRVVVKPLEGEQGIGVAVDLQELEEVLKAVKAASAHADTVLLEQFVAGIDLRIIVINMEVVAAAVRKPAEILGTGRHTIAQLLEKVSRRRKAATGGESQIPLDEETLRCIRSEGFEYKDILPEGMPLQVRRTANLHTGGTIHDVTPQLSDTLREAAVRAAMTLEIPVVGLDFLVPSVEGEQYYIIEANERPGLANHEPQPTAERFIDLLFPYTINDPSG
ncbi:N-acetylglutaminylglutamine synthetase [Bythopirellula goksoeyrii]|uniref:Cyanophycin synthetase n=1 Tax=Bythopirellula goksoeyrii TaxID=1400387 RepID=A0A5B9QUQ5_9BACT|nr:N-acetylglutaminylglutamine synthetase [Bythopirellula goksoeyrii]QEG37653.1 Cyanophycin synthetase [Bythopirellula goksoeyrii]